MWQLLKIFINLTKLIVWLNYKNQCKIIYYLTSLINLQKIISKVTRYLIWGKIYLDLVIPIKFTRISLILPTKNSPLVTLKLIPSKDWIPHQGKLNNYTFQTAGTEKRNIKANARTLLACQFRPIPTTTLANQSVLSTDLETIVQ